MDASFFVLGDKLDQNFICTICSNVMTNPHSCQQGHTFCHSCISTWLQRNASCPTCRGPLNLNKLSVNRVLENFIQKLQVKCLHHTSPINEEDQRLHVISSAPPPTKKTKTTGKVSVGCKWKGPLSDRADHVMTECSFTVIKCPLRGCGISMLRKDLTAHAESCECREVECQHCHKLHRHRSMTAHLAVCGHVKITCPHGCAQEYLRSDKSRHESSCQHYPIPCSMASVGCCVKIPRQDMAAHMRDWLDYHMELLARQATIETYTLKWNVPFASEILNDPNEADRGCKPIVIGLHKVLICFSTYADGSVSIVIRVYKADGVTNEQWAEIERPSMHLSNTVRSIKMIHPTNPSKNYEVKEAEIAAGHAGREYRIFNMYNFIKKVPCLEYLWPDGTVHINITMTLPRRNQIFQTE